MWFFLNSLLVTPPAVIEKPLQYSVESRPSGGVPVQFPKLVVNMKHLGVQVVGVVEDKGLGDLGPLW